MSYLPQIFHTLNMMGVYVADPNITFYNSNIYNQNEEWKLTIFFTVITVCSLP